MGTSHSFTQANTKNLESVVTTKLINLQLKKWDFFFIISIVFLGEDTAQDLWNPRRNWDKKWLYGYNGSKTTGNTMRKKSHLQPPRQLRAVFLSHFGLKRTSSTLHLPRARASLCRGRMGCATTQLGWDEWWDGWGPVVGNGGGRLPVIRELPFQELLPWKLTCPLKINGWKMYSIPYWISPFFRWHVSFGGCNISFSQSALLSPWFSDFSVWITSWQPWRVRWAPKTQMVSGSTDISFEFF